LKIDVDIEFDNDDQKSDINIIDLFKDYPMTETSSGAFKMECPDCGMQGGRTEGFILFPETNSAFCHSSGNWFRLLEAYSLKKGIIRCLDGRQKGGDRKAKILQGELFTMALEEFKNEFGTEMFNLLTDQLKIKNIIELPGNNKYISAFADKLGEVYKSRNVLFYRGESKEIVEMGKYNKITKEGNESVETGFVVVDGGRLVTLIEMFVKPIIKVVKDEEEKTIYKSMNQMTASLVLKSDSLRKKIPQIHRFFEIPLPVLYKNQLTFPKRGYDKRFGSWLPYNAPKIIKKDMTVEEAKQLINSIFEEFCFDEDKDKTHAIAGFITPFLQGMFSDFSTRMPVFIYMANRERAGKDYCAGCTGVLYEGSAIEQPAIANGESGGNNNEELRKKITSCMNQGRKRFHSANNKGLLNNSILEGVTTGTEWEDRLLGKNEVIKFANEMYFSLSGNMGIRLTPDMSNRSRIVNLHLVDEDANSRIFKNDDLHGWILKHRPIILSALYALVRNWVEKGMPKGSVPFTSFKEWSAICGGIMETAGYDNPCKIDKTAIISLDIETEEMKQLFESVYDLYPNKFLTKKDIQQIVENENIMPQLDFNEKSHQIKFGLKIDRFTRRYLSEIFLEVDSLERRPSRRKYKFSKQNILSTGNEGDNCEKLRKSGNDGNLGNVPLPLNKIQKMCHYGSDSVSNNMRGSHTLPPLPPLPPGNLQKFETMTEDIAKKLENEKPEKEKSDRELQYFQSPECENIVEECSKEQVYKWIKLNPNISLQKMDEELGVGCLKHALYLTNENKVKRTDKGWIDDERNN